MGEMEGILAPKSNLPGKSTNKWRQKGVTDTRYPKSAHALGTDNKNK